MRSIAVLAAIRGLALLTGLTAAARKPRVRALPRGDQSPPANAGARQRGWPHRNEKTVAQWELATAANTAP
jgi:hypothetical protein